MDSKMKSIYDYYISDESEIDFLIQHYNINPNGFVHVGAHKLEEKETYNQYVDNKNILWIEANKNLVKLFPNDNVIHALIDDVDGKTVVYNEYNNTKLNSVLELVDENEKKKGFKIVSSYEMQTNRLDTILTDVPNLYNFLVIDVQGYEHKVLSSLDTEMNRFKYIFVETSQYEIYKNCSVLNDIVEKLPNYELKYHRFLNGFGNAFFIRKENN